MKKAGVAPKVREYYPDAKSIFSGKEYFIYSGNTCLGKSKSKAGAWRAAFNNINS